MNEPNKPPDVRLHRFHDHSVTISPGDANGDAQLWCTICRPMWLGPIVTGMTLAEAAQALNDANAKDTLADPPVRIHRAGVITGAASAWDRT